MKPANPPANLAGLRVTVVGLGRFGGGIGVTNWLCEQGASVTVSDKAPREQLEDSLAKIASLDVVCHLGGHEEDDFLKTDLLVVSPAVPKDHPLVLAAEAKGIPRTSEMNLFVQRCPAPIVGITGSAGKSTTTAMTADVLSCSFDVHVGGNIGISLLDELENMSPNDLVVLELSSFQLEDFPLIGKSPRVAVVTNFAANHLDRHGTLAAYAQAKKNIFRYQEPGDLLILNARCEETRNWADEAPGRTAWFDPLDEPFELQVPGLHNQANAQAAWRVAREFGLERSVVATALRRFAGLPHRLQFVAERDGAFFYNDSKCTTPQGAIAALEAFDPGKVVLIAGGYDKAASFDRLGKVIAACAKALIAMGQTAGAIVRATRKAPVGKDLRIERCDSLAQAVAAARRLATAGDVVLLSPACASYDMFLNYERRGEEFTRLVAE